MYWMHQGMGGWGVAFMLLNVVVLAAVVIGAVLQGGARTGRIFGRNIPVRAEVVAVDDLPPRGALAARIHTPSCAAGAVVPRTRERVLL